jgi:uncharacterized integral membrane protein
LRRILRWLVGVPVAIIVIVFAVANRRPVVLSIDPVSPDAPFASVSMPLWLLLFVGIFIGILVGWSACWLAQGKWRRAAREARDEASSLKQEMALLRNPANQTQNRDLTAYPGSFL